MAKSIVKTTTFVGKWMDRPGISKTHHLDAKRTGLRIVTHKWADSDDVEVRLIKGEGAAVTVFASMTVPSRIEDAVVVDFSLFGAPGSDA